jgi:hypothetical protein
LSKTPSPPTGKNPPNNGGGAPGEGGVNLNIENFHYTANELAELRRIAERNPELADKLVDHKERAEIREDKSFRLGLICASTIAIVLFGGVCYTIVQLGVWQSIVFVAAMLALSHILRSVLTGEWSDTSWFGKMISGNKTPPPEDDETP